METCYFNIETNHNEVEKLWSFLADFIDYIGGKGLKTSSTYKTKGYFKGYFNRELVYNVVIKCQINLPYDHVFRSIEGFKSQVHFGVDFLLYGQQSIYGSDEWHLPHPGLNTRACLLVPLLELNPHLVLPDGERVLDKLSTLSDDEVISIQLCNVEPTFLETK